MHLYRRLGRLRHELQALRSRNSYYHHDRSDPARGLFVYERRPEGDAQPAVVVLLNFGGQDGSLSVRFPRAGRWTERLNSVDNEGPEILDVSPGQPEVTVGVPSNYGKLFVSG